MKKKSNAFRDYPELLAALHWLIDDLLTLEGDLCAASGQSRAHQKHSADRLALLAALDTDRLAAALKKHPPSPPHRELLDVLGKYWKRKQPLVGGRTWAEYAKKKSTKKKSAKKKPALAAWAEDAWREEIKPKASVEANLARTAWYVVLEMLTPDDACAAVERMTGMRPRSDDVQQALDSRTAKSPKASREELRAAKLYKALGKRLDPLPKHIEKRREGPRDHLLNLLRSTRDEAALIARATREGKSPVELLDADQRVAQPSRWRAVHRIVVGARAVEPDK